MSNYTTELRFICESYAGRKTSAPQSDIDDIIDLARPDIFNFDYPIFDENYKPELEHKIISHYYTEEIGAETVGLWKHQLKNKMREIMPFYNQMYMSEKIKFDPLINTMLDDSRQSNGETNQSSTQTGNSNNQTEYKDNTVTDKNGSAFREGAEDNNANYTKNVTDITQGSESKKGTDSKGTSAVEILDKKGTETLDKSGNDTVEKTGTDTLSFRGKKQTGDTLKKEGAELTVDIPAHNLSQLQKHSDTPLGSIDGTVSGSQVSGGGSGAVGNYSNYLSDVTEVVSNFDSHPAVGSDSARKRNHSYVWYGKTFNPNTAESGYDTENVPRKDIHDILEDYEAPDSITLPNGTTHQLTEQEKKDWIRREIQEKALIDNETYSSVDRTTHDTQDTKTVDTNDTTMYNNTISSDKTSDTSEGGSNEAHNVSRETSGDTSHDNTIGSGYKVGSENSNNTSQGQTSESKDYFGRMFGKTGSITFSQMLQEYRQTFLNIDMQIIEELQPLFMGIW